MTKDTGQMTRWRNAITWIAGTVLACLCLTASAAPSVSFDIQPRVLRMGETATATLTFREMENPQDPGFPQLNGFQVQPAGTERSISINNGVQSVSTTIRYTLIPQVVGKTTIGPFTYDDGRGNRHELPAVTLEVAQGDAASNTGDLLFARIEPSTTNLYVQQVFDLVVRVYVSTRLNAHSLQPLQNLPAQGLVVRQPRQLESQREAINGEVYNVIRYALKAQAVSAGTYDLAPAQKAEIIAQGRSRRGPFGDSLFDNFFGGVQTEARDIKIAPIKLVIRDLPAAGRPTSFAGAVGQYTFEMTARPQELTAGDPVTLGFRIAGRGNVDSVQMPTLQLGELFKSYDAKLLTQNSDDAASTGDKTFEQVVIPKSSDAKEIPQVTFSYFDPDKNSYVSIARGPFPLAVRPAAKNTQSLIVESTGVPSGSKEKAELLGADIVYLKPAPRSFTRTTDVPWFRTRAALAMQTVPALAVAATYFLVRRREKIAGDVAKTRRLQAPKSARAGIERARAALAANDARQFHDALWEAMSSYFGNRLNLLPGDVTAQRIDDAFARAKYEGPLRRWVEELFAASEAARYGGAPKLDTQLATNQITGLEDALRSFEKIKL